MYITHRDTPNEEMGLDLDRSAVHNMKLNINLEHALKAHIHHQSPAEFAYEEKDIGDRRRDIHDLHPSHMHMCSEC